MPEDPADVERVIFVSPSGDFVLQPNDDILYLPEGEQYTGILTFEVTGLFYPTTVTISAEADEEASTLTMVPSVFLFDQDEGTQSMTVAVHVPDNGVVDDSERSFTLNYRYDDGGNFKLSFDPPKHSLQAHDPYQIRFSTDRVTIDEGTTQPSN